MLIFVSLQKKDIIQILYNAQNTYFYITAKVIWQFLFWNTDYYENRAHVHVGKRNTTHLCKIWLEPEVEVVDNGDLTETQIKEVLSIATEYREKLMRQWNVFKQGKPIRIIKIKKK